jgi:hypothetical protein
MLQAAAKRSRQSIAEFITQWLEDQSDILEHQKRLKEIKCGASATLPWETAREELMDTP